MYKFTSKYACITIISKSGEKEIIVTLAEMANEIIDKFRKWNCGRILGAVWGTDNPQEIFLHHYAGFQGKFSTNVKKDRGFLKGKVSSSNMYWYV